MIGCPQSDSRNQTEKSVSSSHARNSMRSGLHLFLVGRPRQRLSRAVRGVSASLCLWRGPSPRPSPRKRREGEQVPCHVLSPPPAGSARGGSLRPAILPTLHFACAPSACTSAAIFWVDEFAKRMVLIRNILHQLHARRLVEVEPARRHDPRLQE